MSHHGHYFKAQANELFQHTRFTEHPKPSEGGVHPLIAEMDSNYFKVSYGEQTLAVVFYSHFWLHFEKSEQGFILWDRFHKAKTPLTLKGRLPSIKGILSLCKNHVKKYSQVYQTRLQEPSLPIIVVFPEEPLSEFNPDLVLLH